MSQFFLFMISTLMLLSSFSSRAQMLLIEDNKSKPITPEESYSLGLPNQPSSESDESSPIWEPVAQPELEKPESSPSLSPDIETSKESLDTPNTTAEQEQKDPPKSDPKPIIRPSQVVENKTQPTEVSPQKDYKLSLISQTKLRMVTQGKSKTQITSFSPSLKASINKKNQLNVRLQALNGGVLEHSGGSEQEGSFYISELFIESQLTDSLFLRFGQQHLQLGTFNRENNYSLMNFVDPSDLESTILPNHWSEIGLSLVKRAKRFELGLGLFNSLTTTTLIRPDSHDRFLADGIQRGINADAKSPMMNLWLHSTGSTALSFQLSATAGTLSQYEGYKDLFFILGETTLGFHFNQVDLKAQLAYGYLNDSKELNSLPAPPAQAAYGLNSEATLKILSPLHLALRIETYDLNSTPSTGVAVNKELVKNTLAFAVSYHTHEKNRFILSWKKRDNQKENENQIIQLAFSSELSWQ